MRGRHDPQVTMLALVDLEERVPEGSFSADHQGRGRRGVGASVCGVRAGCTRRRAEHRCRLSDCCAVCYG